MKKEDIANIITAIEEVTGDPTVPKNVKNKLSNIINILNDEADTLIQVNKALDELEDIQSDSNLQAFTRTQILNITSLLETI